MKNWNGFVKKKSRTHLRYYLRMPVDRLKETTKSLLATVGEPGGCPPNTTQLHDPLHQFVPHEVPSYAVLSILAYRPHPRSRNCPQCPAFKLPQSGSFSCCKTPRVTVTDIQNLQCCIILIFKLLQQKKRKKTAN